LAEVAFYWPERKLLEVGDAVIRNPRRLSLLREKVMDKPARLRRSVRQLLSLEFDTLLVGDGEFVLRCAKELLQALVYEVDADESGQSWRGCCGRALPLAFDLSLLSTSKRR
jgi:hypothetical protein